MIELKNICKTFATKDSKIAAVKNVSLNINDGEIYGIVGISGAGKSTLVRIINQLEVQDSGSLVIDNLNMSELSNRELLDERKKIGMIFQNFNLLWSRTALENIEFPMEIAKVSKKVRREKAAKLLKLVGLEGRGNSYPSELSGGQKQRVGIARALANEPKLLLCDEATSALDPQTSAQILDLLKKINREYGLTIIMITHQIEAVKRICSDVAIMSDGEIVERGSLEKILTHPKHELTKSLFAGYIIERDMGSRENLQVDNNCINNVDNFSENEGELKKNVKGELKYAN